MSDQREKENNWFHRIYQWLISHDTKTFQQWLEEVKAEEEREHAEETERAAKRLWYGGSV